MEMPRHAELLAYDDLRTEEETNWQAVLAGTNLGKK